MSSGTSEWAKIVARVGVDAHGQVVGDELLDVPRQRCRAVAVGDRLVVGDEHHQIHALVLEADAVAQRAEEMPEMQLAGRAVTGQYAREKCP